MSLPCVVTVWFVNAPDPGAVLSGEPKADRGFGRKLLAQLNPAWPITAIGEFPLNRSSTPGRAEFYIAGYPGVAVVQTYVEDVTTASEAASALRTALPAADTFIFVEGTDSDFAGFAHFAGSELRRAFSATRDVVSEDAGLPEPFEAPFWAGDTAEPIGGISLPFVPKQLAAAAQANWIGVDVSPDGPDLNVVGYAVDGRPEPKIAAPAPRTKTVAEVASRFAEKDKGYDDYVATDTEQDEGGEFAELADASLAAAKRVGRELSRRARALAAKVQERIRHSDR
ncbi:DUF6928 family protein [Corynebacterium lipophiloflavum]|uniref:Uncharacterized protein n=1 Tax=Corynebacterium lipophiloflavum (strain ATCC 700352 / DSM 44291 / CCUG 37336 / JCM 10383 / DMMZ 1944) TaxID=525263 RepID=C0XQB7_CORLD|nr:hypothetical protein [Corynebacterium lipophiloflavum]EEI17605.1 hypothetical protein HMPREF0298_0637 [Corynebacterium lipophiloflavum DSM 44291]